MKTVIMVILTMLSVPAFSADLEKACEGGDFNACQQDLAQHMRGKNGVTKLKDWWNGWTHSQESSSWKLMQLSPDAALFVYATSSGKKDYLIGVKKTSIKTSLSPGRSLASVADCLKYVSEQTMHNARGFPVKVKLFQAVDCKE